MSQVASIIRFAAYLPNETEQGRADLDYLANRIESAGFRLVRNEPYIFAAVFADEQVMSQTPVFLDVFAGTAVSSRLSAAGFEATSTFDDLYEKAEQAAQCFNLIRADSTRFVLASDALGLKPVYVAKTQGGQIMASRVADLLALFPALCQPADAVALYELMCFWAPLAGRTLHEKIRRTVPGGHYEWQPGVGLESERVRNIRPVSIRPLRFVDQTISEIRNAAGASLTAKIEGCSPPVQMALSGGFDSRFIAALLRDHNIPVRAFSFGLRHNEEWRSARAVAKALGLALERVPYHPDNTIHHIAEHLEATDGTADPAALSVMPLLGIGAAASTPLLHGFCGDLQAGSHMHRYSAADYSSRESITNAVMRHYYACNRPELQQLFTPAVDLEAVREDVFDSMRDDCPVHQAYVLWYLENRNRRYVGSQLASLGRHFDMILPLYDRQLFDIWHSVPPVGLHDRRVFRNLLAQYYPQLARIPHPEEVTAIIPNLRQQLARFNRALPQRLLAKAAGGKRAREISLRWYRHGDIMSLSKLAAPQQREHMLARIGELRPALREVLNIDLESGYEDVLCSHLQTLRSMFLAAEYAQRQLRT